MGKSPKGIINEEISVTLGLISEGMQVATNVGTVHFLSYLQESMHNIARAAAKIKSPIEIQPSRN